MNISQYIENDLIEKIRGGEQLPAKLTLATLAAQYEVSLTPVRAALQNLIDAKFILKGDNGRLSINTRKKSKTPHKKREADSGIPHRNYDEIITEDIIHLGIQGEPAYLREESSAQRYGVGRTVIRQVFNRLAGANIIERVPRRGWRVNPFREKEMLDYIDIRETLELKALKLARKHLDPEKLKEFLITNSPDAKGNPQLDNHLHEYWIKKSDNRYIQSFFAQFGIYYSYLFSYSTIATSLIEEKAAEHRKILNALLNKEWDAANSALLQHIRKQRPNVTRFFESLSEKNSTSENGSKTAS
ncbi:MAG: GntR family transcriptional regulator [Verrucomicrobiia bacterium]